MHRQFHDGLNSGDQVGNRRNAAQMCGNTDRCLLFGVIAHQMSFISRDGLVQAVKAWTSNRKRPLGEILVELQLMQLEHRNILEPLIEAYLKQNDNDPMQCMAALSSLTSIKADLDQFKDPELTVSFQQVAASQASNHLLQAREPGPSASEEIRFKILRPHMEGGLGQVSVALDKELNREVALKEIQKKYLNDQASRVRFVLEAEITGGLQHPGIVPVYGLGRFPDGSPFYAMRFIRGDSLKTAIESYHNSDVARRSSSSERRLELRKLLGRFIDVCNAMAYAHSRGVLHRDLKPGNIMLGKYGETLVVDWGLAKAMGNHEIESDEPALSPSAMSSSGQTIAGSALGTPAYMSPEQAAGKLEELGPETDVYSLGATLYHLLTGRRPFSGKIPELMKRVQDGDFIHPCKVIADIPLALEAICLKAMALNPSQRYPSPRLLADDLERWLADEPVTAYSETWSERLTRLERKHRSLFRAATASSATIAVLAIIAALLINVERDKNAKLAVAEGSAKADAINARAVAQAATIQALKEKHTAELQRIRADQNAELERTERKRADAKELEARHRLYLGTMTFVQMAWEGPRIGRALELLEQSGPGTSLEGLRGFEWYYWNRQCHRDLHTLQGHTQAVKAVAFSPDGTRIATASGDWTAKLWEAGSGQEITTLTGHTSFLNAIAFSPDGSRIATASGDATIKLWDVITGQEVRTLQGHAKGIEGVAFSPDGTRIASASADQTVKLWNAVSGDETATLTGHTNTVFRVAFSPDSSLIASASGDKTVKVWNVNSAQETGTLKGHSYAVHSVAFNPDGLSVASACVDGTVKLWDVATNQATASLNGHTRNVFDVAFSADGKRLATSSLDQTVRVWNSVTGQLTGTLKGHTGGVFGVAFSPDGSRIASASEDLTIKLWDATTGDEHLSGQEHGFGVHCVAFSPDSELIASAGDDHTVKLWNASTGLEATTLTGHTNSVYGVAFSPNGSMIASASRDRSVKLWVTATGQERATLTGHSDFVYGVTFSPDGGQIASAGRDTTIRLWDAASGQEVATLRGHTDHVKSVAFSPDGKHLASASLDHTINIWDIARRESTTTLKGHRAAIECVVFNSDGTLIASASHDKTIRLWNSATGLERITLRGHTAWVTGLAISRDGTRLASSCADGTIKLWDLPTGMEIASLIENASWIRGVAFSPDGTRLASANWVVGAVQRSHTVKLWDARVLTPELRLEQQACCLLNSIAAKATTREAFLNAIESNRTFSVPARKLALHLASTLAFRSLVPQK